MVTVFCEQISEWFVDQGFADEPFEFMWDEGLFVIDNAIGGHPDRLR